ncbi:MAG: hypothetical protein M1832_004264 [Thelocarpon impressellum]|nr:MAG: hypothetical protein M1832_004264 [Thelocarpon impressellum]
MYSTRASIRLGSIRPCKIHRVRYVRPSSNRRNASTISDGDVEASRRYCSNLLQKYDAPSYTLQPFVPRPAQTAHLCIRAFNVTLSRVADSVSNPAVGALRMQYWRDAIARTFDGDPPKEPVAVLLAHVLAELRQRRPSSSSPGLNKAWFMRVIDARARRLHNAPYVDLAALEAYAEQTYSSLLYLTLAALPLHSLTADHLASHVGKAAGITAVLRGLPLLAFPPPPTHSSGHGSPAAVTLPLDVMAAAGVREEDVLRRGGSAPGLGDAVFAVATRAHDHLLTARAMLASLRAGEDVGHAFEHADEHLAASTSSAAASAASSPAASPSAALRDANAALPVLLSAIPTSLWLERLERADFDVFSPQLRRREWRLPWRAYLAHRRGGF